MIRSLFVSLQDLNRGARRPAGVPAVPIKKVGILGAGFMGAGIASVSAQAGIDVVLIDRDQESADKGKAGIPQEPHRSGQQGPHDGRRARYRAGARDADSGLCRARRLRSRGRSRVRRPQGEG